MLNDTEYTWYECWEWPTCLPVYLGAEVFNCLLGLTTNTWFLWLMAQAPAVQVTKEIFTISLAAVEMLYCLLSPLLVINIIFIHNQTIHYFQTYILGLVIVGRPIVQCCICMERYLAVVHPVVFLQYRPLRYRVTCVAVALSLALVTFVVRGLIGHIAFDAAVFITVLLIDVFCSISILMVLRRSGPADGGKNEREAEGSLMKKRASRIVQIILLTLLVNYCPVIIGAFLYNNISVYSFDCILTPITFTFSVLGSFTQSLFYLHREGKLPCIGGKREK